MSTLTFRAQAFGPLNRVEWTVPPGVTAVVGPNRVGKSTLLNLPAFLRSALVDSLSDAMKEFFDGPAYFRTLGAPAAVVCGAGASVDDISWNVDISFAGGTVAKHCAEQLRLRENLLLTRTLGATQGDANGRGVPLGADLIPKICMERVALADSMTDAITDLMDFKDVPAERIAQIDQLTSPVDAHIALAGFFLGVVVWNSRSYRTYEYQLSHLLRYGSRQSSELELHRSGENIFPLLRNWRDSSETEDRFEFVMSTLREIFPHIKKVDFEQAGQSVTMAIRDQRWSDQRLPISRESTGLVTALLQLCAVASCRKGGLVTIDELETSLHPHAIRTLIAAFRRWASEHDLRIVLATQSETVLDQFRDDPGQIYVIEPGQEVTPRSLTDMFTEEWLSQFSLGDLFSHLEFGSNGEKPTGA
jgi:hypothetical protein